MDIWTFGRLIKVALKNPWLFSEQVFAVFSNLGGNYEEILVTLLGKASLWADPEGSFQVLSTRLELCHPVASTAPAPLAVEEKLNHRSFPPVRHQGGDTDITAHSNTVAHKHFFHTHPQPPQLHTSANGVLSRHPLSCHNPPALPHHFFNLHAGCRAAEKDLIHT